jgi:DNA-binding response OmpR family regulator
MLLKVLIVEDNRKINQNIKLFLKDKKFNVVQAFDGKTGLEKGISEHFDVIVLDIMLPVMDGLEVCRQLRERSVFTPIIMLTALDQVSQKVAGLDAGADDYLAKPFDLEELDARLRALMRRKKAMISEVIVLGDLNIDAGKRQVLLGNEEVGLTVREFDLLYYLATHLDKVTSKERLLETVWGGGDRLMFSETVEVHVSFLRKKLGKNVIRTVRGAGYIIDSL